MNRNWIIGIVIAVGAIFVRSQMEADRDATGAIRVIVRTDDFFDDPETTNGISWQVLDDAGDVVYARDGFEDKTIYRDTLRLPDGCYRFVITDSYFGDGLIPIRGTAGNYQLRDEKNTVIMDGAAGGQYLASFGDQEVTSFVVSSTSGAERPAERAGLDAISLFPNPSSGRFTLDLGGIAPTTGLTLSVTTMSGAEILRRPLDAASGSDTIDLSSHPAGTYLVRIDADGGTWIRKVIVEKR